jgi:hypothetical protein
MKLARVLPLVASLSLLGGCRVPTVTKAERADGFALRASAPLRIAVLPLRDTVPGPSIVYYLGRPFVWLARAATFNFKSSMPPAPVAAQMMRVLLAARLASEATTIVDITQLDCAMANCKSKDLLVKPIDAAAAVALAKELDVDAVLEGELRGLGAGWAVVRTNRELAGVVRLRSAADGSVLFAADVAIGNSVGIDHGPTGWVSLVATPLAALDSGPYTAMAIDWAEVVGRELLGGSLLAGDLMQPVLSLARVEAPERVLGIGDVIEVVAEGTAGALAHFHLGALHREVPMFVDGDLGEGRARYRGMYRVRAGDRLAPAPVTVCLWQPGGGEAVLRPERQLEIGKAGGR